jgi:hypothetical protein
MTPLPPEGPSPGWACHSKESRFTPVKRTVQPPLAVTIWFPETFSRGGAAPRGEKHNRQMKTETKRKKFPARRKNVLVKVRIKIRMYLLNSISAELPVLIV